ncbi:MAG: EamA family transporter, partial [Chloroflexi bacterium]|nr:EamA family transporter [Chloroflexota bacterium]
MSATLISILLGVSGMVGWGIYDFLGGVFSKQIGSFKSLFWSQLAGLIAILLLVFAFRTDVDLPVLAIALSPLASIVYSAGYLFFFKGFEKGNVSIIAATMNLWAVFTMLFAFLFMGQRLSTTQTIGVFLILSGATLAAIDWKSINKQGFQLSLGVREAILGAFFFGVFWNISEIVSEEIGWLLSTALTKIGITIFLLVFSLFAKQEIGLTNIPTKTKYAVLLMGIIE